jgi:hypothetical protein
MSLGCGAVHDDPLRIHRHAIAPRSLPSVVRKINPPVRAVILQASRHVGNNEEGYNRTESRKGGANQKCHLVTLCWVVNIRVQNRS